MALSETTRQKLRQYLGYPSTGFQIDRELESAMDAVDAANRAALFTNIDATLEALDAVETQLLQAMRRLKFDRLEDAYYAGAKEMLSLRGVGRMHVQRLATLVGARVRSDAYSPGGGDGSNLMHHG